MACQQQPIVQGINDKATLLTRYTAAVQALDNLLTGNMLQAGRHSIEQMEFTPTNAGQLRAYISDLAGQLAAQGVQVPGRRVRGKAIICAP